MVLKLNIIPQKRELNLLLLPLLIYKYINTHLKDVINFGVNVKVMLNREYIKILCC